MADEKRISGWAYVAVAAVLFGCTLGFAGVFTVLVIISSFVFGMGVALVQYGPARYRAFIAQLAAKDVRFSTGIPQFCARDEPKKKLSCEERMTGSPVIDSILDEVSARGCGADKAVAREIISLTLRDYLDVWYCQLTNDEQLKESLRRSARRTAAVLSAWLAGGFDGAARRPRCSLRRVDWVPLLTQHIVDDFASHIRLYRKARERAAADGGDLESAFFDLELAMEKTHCRDLLATSRQYENAYLHDISDILMQLLIPAEDFRSRPFRLLLREILVKRILLPLVDLLSDADYINHTITWLLAEVPLNSDDFLATIEISRNADELTAIRDCVDEHIAVQRARDTGGDDASAVKQQLGSLLYVRRLMDARLRRLSAADGADDCILDSNSAPSDGAAICDLPLSFVLANSISVSYFIDYLSTVGGQSFIDLFLAIQGFKVSVENQLSSAHLNRILRGQQADPELYKTIRGVATALFNQYLSEEAAERVAVDEATVAAVQQRIASEEPSDAWFDDVQAKVYDELLRDERFFVAFRRSPLYVRMLADLGLINRDGSRVGDTAVCDALDLASSSAESASVAAMSEPRYDCGDEPRVIANITTIGIGREANATFALYNVQVSRENSRGEHLSSWSVLRRYSDFHTLHALVEKRCPALESLSFPGKKTFNNLTNDFLEKRKIALNIYLTGLLYPEVLKHNEGLEQIVMNFLCQKEYTGEKASVSSKVLSLVNPIRTGVRAFGFAVTAVPESVFGGVARVGDGIGRVTKSMLGVPPTAAPVASPFEGRVAASIMAAGGAADLTPDSIPLRILLLFIDDVFGLRQRNQWFRRRLVAVLRQLVHATQGTVLNRKIIDMVLWLTSEEQAAEYLRAFRNSFWPGGVLADAAPERPHHIQMRTRVVTQSKLLGALPDELRLFIGSETTRDGIKLVFEALQNSHLNRRMFYVVFERLLVTVFPDNRFEHIIPKLHSKSPRFQTSTGNAA